jgi:hypothetical protein
LKDLQRSPASPENSFRAGDVGDDIDAAEVIVAIKVCLPVFLVMHRCERMNLVTTL